jgi:hypothetical protein
MQTTIEIFTPRLFNAENIAQKINHPSNAINLSLNAHREFDSLLWEIEALTDDSVACLFLFCTPLLLNTDPQNGNKLHYYYRIIKPGWSNSLLRHNDGNEIVLTPPDDLLYPSYCNIKLAVGRVLHVCGASKVIDYLFQIHEDHLNERTMSYLDSSLTMLDLFDIRLHQIAI